MDMFNMFRCYQTYDKFNTRSIKWCEMIAPLTWLCMDMFHFYVKTCPLTVPLNLLIRTGRMGHGSWFRICSYCTGNSPSFWPAGVGANLHITTVPKRCLEPQGMRPSMWSSGIERCSPRASAASPSPHVLGRSHSYGNPGGLWQPVNEARFHETSARQNSQLMVMQRWCPSCDLDSKAQKLLRYICHKHP